MQKLIFALLVSFLICVNAEANGGIECGACTIITDLIDQLATIHKQTADKVLENICDLFPDGFKTTCINFIDIYGEAIIQGLINFQNADDICHDIGVCTGPQCRLLPKNSKSVTNEHKLKWKKQSTLIKAKMLVSKTMKASPWQWILDLINKLAEKHEPILDLDGDLFSFEPTLRGANWRGKDCNDENSQIYPGRGKNPYPGAGIDYNCNGINGKNSNGKEWKDVLCSNSQQRGVIVIGDSAGAHFSIPPKWMTPKEINNKTYSDMLWVVSNELDIPHKSGYTGFVEGTPDLPVSSLYKYMRERNRCNHRDFQNLAVNGARSGPAAKLSQSLARNNKTDPPLLAVLELIGNDVCSPHPSLGSMTQPADFEKNIMDFLNTFDTLAPPNSHLLIFGLVDGRLLWNTLWNRTHPIGVTYQRVYDFLNCLEVNPCWAWLNSNETVRNAGSARAVELNNVYRKIIANNKWKNFDIAYYTFPAKEIIEEYVAKGGDPADLIEPIDGFHPSGLMHSMLGDWIFDTLSKNYPDWLGPINPNNQMILNMFGDQGGY